MDLLRFTTAGSVDDGKSTLIGRLLVDSRAVYEDQIDAVRNSPVNRAGGAMDFSLLTDGLRAEREQGITIDVAYRYFATPRRKFIIADTPGHEQYTRNMATGASTADLAIVLIDARNGVLPQSRRHSHIAALLGIRHIVVAVNKMDLVDFSEAVFAGIRAEFSAHLERIGVRDAYFLPISALEGDNVIAPSARTPWFAGESLLEHLENVPVDGADVAGPLRLPVQYVIRPDASFRGYAGQLVSGTVRPGDEVLVLPSGERSRVKSIVAWGGDRAAAQAPMAANITLEDELDISRGDMLVSPAARPEVSRGFEATLVWMNEQPLRPGRRYLLKHTTQMIAATVTALLHRVDVNTLAEKPAATLELNGIGRVEIETSRPLFFDPYTKNSATGSFILIDPITNATVGAGMIRRATRAARSGRVTAEERQASFGHRPAAVWLEGRRELAFLVERILFQHGCHAHVVEGATPGLVAQLAGAGLISIFTGGPIENRDAFFCFDALPEDDERAAQQVLAALEEADVLPHTRFREREGI
jgi:sulfate adenylyltransferase large subunit